MNRLDILEIEKKKKETPTIESIYFKWEEEYNPGQFVMIWIPGIDDIPMAISKDEAGLDFITVKKRGESTRKLHQVSPGEKIGVRGPFGSGYDIQGDIILLVTGGCGGASLMEVVNHAHKKNIEVITCLGAKTEEELLFKDKFSEMTDLKIATDDGSSGHHGYVTELAESVIEKEEINLVFTCGPEIMMKKIVEICVGNDIPVQASLERYMKCGIGICDSCSIDGKQVCQDGPVFKGRELLEYKEFGKYERTKEGKLVKL